MAAPESPRRRSGAGALAVLTAAALAIPGLAALPAQAADEDGATLTFQHYSEGERDLHSRSYQDLNIKPLRVDSLDAGLNGHLSDRVKFGFGFTQDTWSGATPVATAPQAAIADQVYSGASRPLAYYADAQGHPVDVNWDTYDGNTVAFSPDSRLVHVMGSASPETRRQASAKLGYEWDNATLGIGGGISTEPDYFSRFASASGSFDFNRKLTTLSWSASFTSSDIHASLEADKAADWGAYTDQIFQRDDDGAHILQGSRRDLAFGFGLSQVLSPEAVVEASVGYTRSSGYLSNPYKAVVFAFDDPGQFIDSTGLRLVVLQGVLEKRPSLRNQWDVDFRYVQHVPALDAALHLDYRFYRDDWGISAHTFDASWMQPLGAGWMVTAGARYYTQSAANFFQTYFLFDQAFPILGPINPELPRRLDFSQVPITYYSSDERLGGFGVLSGRLAISKTFANGARVEIGGEYSRHAGSLKLGGGGEGGYADFSSYTGYAALRIDLAGRSHGSGGSDSQALDLSRAPAPAGIMFDRVLDHAGEVRVRYRYDVQYRDGALNADDQTIIDQGCGDQSCQLAPDRSGSHASTLEIMYAARDWLTLVAAPTLVDRRLDVRPLDAGLSTFCCVRPGSGAPNYRHSSGGVGDTRVYALARLFQGPDTSLHAGLGVGIPTGNSGVRVNNAQDYASLPLQLGSGVWQLLPSLTYLGQWRRWSWGAQVAGQVRLQSRNSQGYAFGNRVAATAWGGYSPAPWATFTARLAASAQASASGAFAPHTNRVIVDYTHVGDETVAVYGDDIEPNVVNGPMDMAASQGGRYADVGLGFSVTVPKGPLSGQRLSFEWLQPLHDHPFGFQLKRTGALSASWSLAL